MTIIVILMIALLFVVWVIYSKLRQNKITREPYALRCLTAIVTLVTLAIATISSKKGLPDHIIDALSVITGHPQINTEPASISEQILLAIFVGFVVYLILNSYRHWQGRISVDEANRRLFQRPNMFLIVSQAVDESARILTRAPERQIYKDADRLKGDVKTPLAPPLVWHEHARELFELWLANSWFDSSDSAWDGDMQCWMGRHTRLDQPLILFCRHHEPDSAELDTMASYVGTLSKEQNALIFVAHRGPTPQLQVQSPSPIHCVSESFLLDHLVDFTDYFYEIRRRVEKQRFPDTDKTLNDIYSPSSLTTSDGTHVVSEDMGRTIEDWATRPPGRQLAILGDYGQGKSTGALMFVYESSQTAFSKTGGRIPILLELRGKSPSNMLPEELLGSWSQQYKIQAKALIKLLIAGRLVLIFEGFDEMANVSRPDDRLAHFRALWQFAYPESKLLFTGRPNFFFEDRELDVVFKTTEGADAPGSCDVLRLAPFTLDKIRYSLRWARSDARNEIIDAAESSAQIFDIVSRPSLLYIVATLWDELKAILLARGGITSAHIIDRFILHSYQRQAAKETRLGFMTLTTSERRYFHEGVAVFMACQGSTNQITASEMEAAIRSLYTSYPDDVHISDQVIMEADVRPLKTRLDPDTAVDTINTDVRTHGVLVHDLNTKNAFRFAHKSFYELLFAKSYAYAQLSIEPIFYNALRSAMHGRMGDIAQSIDVFRFYAEILTGKLSERKESNNLVLTFLDVVIGGSFRKRPLIRAAVLIIIRFTTKTIRRYISVGIMMVFTMALMTTFLGFLKVWYVDIPLLSIPFTLGLIGFGLAPHAVFYARRCAIRWVAILICADAAMGTGYVASDLARLVGPRSATDLVAAVYARWPGLARKITASADKCG